MLPSVQPPVDAALFDGHGLACAGAWEDASNSCDGGELWECGAVYANADGSLTGDLICECAAPAAPRLRQ
eukprot:gene7946-17314_t